MEGDATLLFQGDQHATLYIKYRSKPAAVVVDRILKFLSAKKSPPFDFALDIACGSGLSTNVLSPYFKHVLGVDISQALIDYAVKNNTTDNVSFKIGVAESLPVADCSVDLITAANAVHWFDIESFMAEADRVLKPGGVVALYGYDIPKPIYKNISDKLFGILKKHYTVSLANYWNKKVEVADKRYQGIKIPFSEETVSDLSIFEDVESTVANLCGLIESWSASQTLRKENPEYFRQLMEQLEKSFLEEMEVTSLETRLVLRWKYHMILGRKHL